MIMKHVKESLVLAGMVMVSAGAVAEGTASSAIVDPFVKASAYGDKAVWSYHSQDPLPWAVFHPKDYGSSKIAFEAKGVRPVGRVPAPGVHPRTVSYTHLTLPTNREV